MMQYAGISVVLHSIQAGDVYHLNIQHLTTRISWQIVLQHDYKRHSVSITKLVSDHAVRRILAFIVGFH